MKRRTLIACLTLIGMSYESKKIAHIYGGTCLLRHYLPVFAQTKRCEFALTQKGNFAKKYKRPEFAPTHYFEVTEEARKI